MNVFTGIGRLGRDAEVKYTADGKPITTFAVAIDDGFGERKTTTWLDCAFFGERGPKVAEFIRKGDRIGITGSIRLETFKTRDGEDRSKVALRVAEVTLLGEKRDDAPQRSGPAKPRGESKPQHSAPTQGDDFSDSIPF